MKAPAAKPTDVIESAGRKHDTGLLCLVSACRDLQIEADIESVSHDLALNALANIQDLIRAATQFGLKADSFTASSFEELAKIPRPIIIRLKTGNYITLKKRMPDGDERIRDPLAQRPVQVSASAIAAQWDGTAIVLSRNTESATIVGSKKFGLGWFIENSARYKKPLLHVLFISVFIQLFALVTPLFFQIIVDKVLVHRSLETLNIVAIGLIVIGFFDVLLQYLRSYALYHTATRIDVELSSEMFSRLFKLPLSYFETRAAGQTVARFRELETIRTFLTGQVLTSVIDVVFAFLYLFVLFSYSPKLAFVVTGAFPIYILIVTLIRPRLRQKISEKFNRGALSQQFLVETIVGAHTLKAAAVEPLLQKQWEERVAAYVKRAFEALMLSSFCQGAIQYVSKLSTALILFVGAKEVISGNLSVGQLVAFNMLANQLVAPLLRISQLWQDVQQIQISVDRLGDVFNAEPEEPSGVRLHMPGGKIQGAIELQSVSFKYRSTLPNALSNISIVIPKGQIVGIVGPSGSGKSTITKLIQGMYVPQEGRVLIDDLDISQVRPAWFRRQIGVVLQENMLFNKTIHENIALTNPGMSRAKVIEVASLAGADEFVRQMPHGYDTAIQERGANLSGGQRQRIAIARALARNPRILVFDEATSALDYESEYIIQKNMHRIVEGRTVIIIAHRLAAVRCCDRIISMKQGHMVEDGTHDVLSQLPDGLYASLLALQNAPPNVDEFRRGTQYMNPPCAVEA